MLADRWTRVQTLFEDALDRPPDERTAWLRAACGDDPALYREVEALLEADDDHHALFDGRAADVLSPAEMDEALAPTPAGERVGPWALEARIGTGGMGAVYRARRAVEAGGFEQTTALKRVKPGMDSEAVLARFRAERQILARLEHPGIARLLDGGLDAAGRPYFAMELVEGEPITAFCDRRRLGVEARLRLLAEVCEAVAYAHRQLVVHRDLKPSNVLVAEGDGTGDGGPGTGEQAGPPSTAPRPRVKLLDFGIAKVLSDEGLEAGLTRTGHRVLTPATAAPEQVRGEPPTTATDVYALGALLYTLLCGAPPVDPGGSPAAVERAVLEAVPARPGARVTPEAAAQRGTTPGALEKRLRGDLDTICLKALRKEPERRYGSAAELLADLRRHLAGQPVEARPATARYRAGLFVRRHRAGVLGTTAAVLALVALTGFYTVRLAGERDRAETEAETSEQTVAFLRGLFEGADPDAGRGLDLTAAELLAAGARRIETDLDGQPDVQAAMHLTIGSVYEDLGAYDSARVHLERALALREALGDPLEVSAAQTALGTLLRRAGEPERAVALHQAAIEARRARLGPDAAPLGASYVSLGTALHDLGRLDETEAAYLEAIRILERADAPEEHAVALSNLSNLLYDRGDLAEAVALGEKLLAVREELYGPVHTAVASTLGGQGVVLHELGRYDEAEAAYRRAVEIDRTLLGDEHPDLAIDLNNLGILLYDRGGLDAAEDAFDEALSIKRAVYPAGHPQIATTLKSLGFLYSDAGRPREAERRFLEALEIRRVALGADHPGVGEVLGGLARLYTEEGDHARAVPLYEETVRTLAGALGEDHPYTAVYQVRHADALHRSGRAREAAAGFAAAAPAAREVVPADGESGALVELLVGRYLADVGRCAEAAPALRRAAERYRQLGDVAAATTANATRAACRA